MDAATYRRAAAAALLMPAVLGGCEHPLPSANPAPFPAAANHLGVSVSVLRELRETGDRLEHTRPPASSPPAAAGPELDRLRRTLRLLEQSDGTDAGGGR